MKILIVEDDQMSMKLMQHLLNSFGDVDIATNGQEALDTFNKALKEDKPYDLVCLDIMMPEMDGQTVLKEMRILEDNFGIHSDSGAKIFMTTALWDTDNIVKAFEEQCDAYLIKPIDHAKIEKQLQEVGLIE